MDDSTIEQVQRMRTWIIQQYLDHALQCNVCQCQRCDYCPELERMLTLLRKWSWLDIELQEKMRFG